MMRPYTSTAQPIEVLLIEDNAGDVRLTLEALRDAKVLNHLSIVSDGVEAMAFLHKQPPFDKVPRPDIILLDLNLPRMNGREVLREIKTHESLRRIPVVILTTSRAEEDILRTYDLHANCFVTKPVDFDQFELVVRSISDFWFEIVKLPPAN